MPVLPEPTVDSRSESLKLHIGSEGPAGGPFAKSNSQNVFLYSPAGYSGNSGETVEFSEGGVFQAGLAIDDILDDNNIPPVDDDTGVFHFTNWEAKLTSLQVDNKERFEVSSASNFMGYKWGASRIKIVDDVAAIGYPDYTHLNKVVWEHEDGGLYQPWVYYSSIYDRYENFFILPLLNHSFSKDFYGVETDGSNIFMIVEYDGYYSSAGGTISSGGSTITEVFRYTAQNEGTRGTFFFDDGTINGKYPPSSSFVTPVGHFCLNSSVNISSPASYFTDGTNSDARITTARVTAEVSELENRLISYHTADAAYYSTGEMVARAYDKKRATVYPGREAAWGFLGYSKITIIKYQPIVKCGKVDLYSRKSGNVTAFTTDGVITSADHDLQNNDIVKFSSGLGRY
jgi:hypothetical protein